MENKNKSKEKQIKKSEIVAVSADRVVVRNALLNKEMEVNKKIILICYHLIDYLAYICLVLGVIIFFLIPIAGLLVVALSKLLFDMSAQYKMTLQIMKSFKKEDKKRD